MRLTKANARFGPLKVTLDNPTRSQALYLIIAGVAVSLTLFIIVFVLLVGKIAALMSGDTSFWTIAWTIAFSLYLINAVSGD